MLGQGFALFAGFPGAYAVSQGDIAQMTVGIGRRGEGQHVGGLILAQKAGVKLAQGFVVREQDGEAPSPLDGFCLLYTSPLADKGWAAA